MDGDDKWDSWETAKRLGRLSRGEGEIIWAPAAGFVHAKRLWSTRGLWDFTPLSGDKWRWLMVGHDTEVGWKVTFADGWNEPLTVVDGTYDAEGALIEAVDFLGWDKAVRVHELALEPASEAPAAPLAGAGLDAAAQPSADVEAAVQRDAAAVEAPLTSPELESPAHQQRELGGAGYEL